MNFTFRVSNLAGNDIFAALISSENRIETEKKIYLAGFYICLCVVFLPGKSTGRFRLGAILFPV